MAYPLVEQRSRAAWLTGPVLGPAVPHARGRDQGAADDAHDCLSGSTTVPCGPPHNGPGAPSDNPIRVVVSRETADGPACHGLTISLHQHPRQRFGAGLARAATPMCPARSSTSAASCATCA